MFWYARIFAFDDLFIKSLHIVSSEWRHERTHFVQHTAKGPNVTFWIIRTISPNLRACIIRCSRLSITKPFFLNLGNVKISQFGLHISIQENVCALHISVQYFSIVKSFEPAHDLDKNVPNLLFFYIGFTLLIIAYFLEDISVISIFHYETKFEKLLLLKSYLP